MYFPGIPQAFPGTFRGIRPVYRWMIFSKGSMRQKEGPLDCCNGVPLALPSRWEENSGEEHKTRLLAKKVAKHENFVMTKDPMPLVLFLIT